MSHDFIPEVLVDPDNIITEEAMTLTKEEVKKIESKTKQRKS